MKKEHLRHLISAAFAAWLSLSSARAQAPLKPVHLAPPIGDPGLAHEEMEKLIGKVEVRLRKVDHLLADAGAGDASALKHVGTSGLDELLKKGREEAQGAADDIDRILQLADHEHRGGT